MKMRNITKKTICNINIKIIRISFLLLSFFISISVYSQNNDIRFEKITKDNGLSTMKIYDICQDSIGFLWFATNEGLNRYDGYNIKVYKHDPIDKNSISSNLIRKLYVDKEGLLWIGTDGGGVNLYDPANDNFTCYTTISDNPNSLSNDQVYSICEDYQGFIWFGTKFGLNKFDKKNKKFTRYIDFYKLSGGISDNLIFDIFEDKHKNLWIGTSNGLNKFLRERNKFIYYKNDPANVDSISNNSVYAITEDRYGYLWLATENYVNRMNIESEKFIAFKNDVNNPNTIGDNIIKTVYNDRSGNLWIGTFNGGLSKYNFDKNNFTNYKNDTLDPFSISNNYVNSIYEDKSGILWIGTYNSGINKYNPERHHFQYNIINHYDTQIVTGNYNITAICKDKYNNYWFGTDKGLNQINSNNGLFKVYKADPEKPDPDSYCFTHIYSIYEDMQGELWIGSINGLLRYNHKLSKFEQYHYDTEDPYNVYEVLYITENHQGDLILGTNKGLSVFNRRNKTFTKYLNMENQDYNKKIYSIITDDANILWLATFKGLLKFDLNTQKYSRFIDMPVFCLYEDKFKNLWLGTQGHGLAKFDRRLETFTFFTEKDGLSYNTVYGILEDNEGDLWLSTDSGISKFNPGSTTFYNYNIKDGLIFNELNIGAYYKDNNDNFYFGGNRGFISFDPVDIKKYVNIPRIVITDFRLSDKSIKIDKKGILKKNIIVENAVVLPYKEKIFSFEFSALNYSSPNKNKYAYKLEGFDKDWNYLTNHRFVSFKNLSAGRYQLWIKGSNKDNIWNEIGTSLKIRIKPPLWRSWWAYSIYLILIVGCTILIIWLIMKRQAEIYEEKIKTITIKNLKQVNEQKTNFFINIAHEIKTPITIISNYLNHHIQQSGLTYDLKVVKNNLDKLTRDILNYLDVEKLARGQIFYNHNSVINLSKFVNEKSNIFQKIAKNKQIKLEKNISSDILFKVDPDAFDRILNNLLDNAIKYTEKGGKIKVNLTLTENNKIVLAVSDNGVGISEDQQKDIFKPYYQISHKKKNIQGIGMGLNIVKNIVDELGGRIDVQKNLNKGTTFSLLFDYIPLSNEDITENYSGDIKPVESISIPFLEEKYEKERQTIFLVEDNTDMLSFLQNNLAALYNVYYALNGKQALNKINKLPVCPDLILSDIMMDEMDGYTFYDILIKKKKYKDIPFIFLTARSNADERVKGLSKGAVDFISKPFVMEEVTAKINSILKIKKALELKRTNEIGLKIYEYINRATVGLNYNTNISIQEKLLKIKKDYHISDQELKVFSLLEQDLEYKEIADILNITINTVDTYRKRLFKKCNVRSKKNLLKILSGKFKKTNNIKN